jgi:hypothetical protein
MRLLSGISLRREMGSNDMACRAGVDQGKESRHGKRQAVRAYPLIGCQEKQQSQKIDASSFFRTPLNYFASWGTLENLVAAQRHAVDAVD